MRSVGYTRTHTTSVPPIRKNLFQEIWLQMPREDGVETGRTASQATEGDLEQVVSSWALEGFSLANSVIADFWPPAP